jgi:hypothetical protein
MAEAESVPAVYQKRVCFAKAIGAGLRGRIYCVNYRSLCDTVGAL